jgi:hypothetical protein
MSHFDPSMTVGQFIRAGRTRVEGDATQTAATSATADKPADAATGETKGAPEIRVYKADAELGVISLFASAAGVTDKDGEIVPQSDLVAMAHNFCAAKAREFNANHGQNHFDLSKAELVESIVGAPVLKSGRVVKLGEELPAVSDDPVVAINIEKGNEAYWMFSVRPNNDEVVEEAKKGGVIGSSWEGLCRKVEVTNA